MDFPTKYTLRYKPYQLEIISAITLSNITMQKSRSCPCYLWRTKTIPKRTKSAIIASIKSKRFRFLVTYANKEFRVPIELNPADHL